MSATICNCNASYNASKAGVVQMTRMLAAEWGRYNINVNCLSPSYVLTPMHASTPTVVRRRIRELTPLGHVERPEDLYGAVIFLAAAASNYVTGHDLVVDGGHTTATKVAEAREQLAQGATELDMVINVGMLRSGRDRDVENDIRAVVEAAQETPVKVILEAHHLTDEEILRGSWLAAEAGAAFVKTGTGWAPTGATLHNVRLIKAAVGDAVGVKAAGGVRVWRRSPVRW